MSPKKTIGRKTPPGTPRRVLPGTKDLERMFAGRGFSDFRWIHPRDIVVAEWVRMKCLYGCVEYGKNAACPPNAPPVDACARFFREYKRAAVFHFVKKVDRPDPPPTAWPWTSIAPCGRSAIPSRSCRSTTRR